MAVLISVDDPIFGVDSITRDTVTGLDWLDVTASLGRSFHDVNNEFGPGGDFEGWRYAIESELVTLFLTSVGVPFLGSLMNTDPLYPSFLASLNGFSYFGSVLTPAGGGTNALFRDDDPPAEVGFAGAGFSTGMVSK